MSGDDVVDEIDGLRRSLLTQCGGNLVALLKRMAMDSAGREGRVQSREEFDRAFPQSPLDLELIATLGEPWRDPIVEEVRRVREQLWKDGKIPSALAQSENLPSSKSRIA